MNDIADSDVRRAESLLRPLMPDCFVATYIPDFPGRNGAQVRWFQVVFAVGPGETVVLRSKVHALFSKMLVTLAEIKLATESDVLSLRARRRCPDSEIYNPDHPFTFIEADWAGAAFRRMCAQRDFSQWHTECTAYRNLFDPDDVFTRKYSGQAI